jgi:hypothetical protein
MNKVSLQYKDTPYITATKSVGTNRANAAKLRRKHGYHRIQTAETLNKQ